VDTVLLLSCSPSICCVANGIYFRSPLVGRLMRASNHIDTGDGGVFTAGQVIQTGLERLRGGDSVLIFPEGTRSPKDGLGAFKPGAFALAQRAKVPLVLVRITCTPRGLMKGMAWYTVPDGTMNFTMTVLPTPETSGFDENGRALAANVRTIFLGAEERSRAPDPAVVGLQPGAGPADRTLPPGRVVDGRVGT